MGIPLIPSVQVVCDILLEHSQQWLQLFFRLYFNRRFTHKVVRVPILRISGFPFGSPRQNDIWVLVPWPGTKYTIKGKVVVSPKFEPWWVLWVRVCSWFVYAPKWSNYALTNLFGLCRSVWVTKLLVNLLSPISELQHAPLPWSVVS